MDIKEIKSSLVRLYRNDKPAFDDLLEFTRLLADRGPTPSVVRGINEKLAKAEDAPAVALKREMLARHVRGDGRDLTPVLDFVGELLAASGSPYRLGKLEERLAKEEAQAREEAADARRREQLSGYSHRRTQ